MASARRTIRLSLAAVTAAVLASSLVPGPASALVTLRPGESSVVAAGTTTPALPPKLDVVILMDTTGSMGGEISNVQTGANSTFDTIRADSPDSNFAVAAFDDYPYSTYGSPTIMMPANAPDRPYYLLKDLTSVKAEWQTAINALDTNNGLDIPESQVPALFAAATGSSLTWPGGSTPGGAGISFRSNAAHVIVLVSDAAFHNDKAGNDAYAGFTAPTYAEALAALTEDHARVIAIDSGTAGDPPTGTGSFPDMTAIATDTGATRSLIPGTGVGLSPAMLAALDALTYDVTSVISCDPLQVGLNPESFSAVAHESPVAQNATITVPADVSAASLPHEAPLDCVVGYTWGDVAIASFVQQVQVVLQSSIEVEGNTTNRRVKASGTLTPGHDAPGITVTLLRKKRLGGFTEIEQREAALKPEGRFSAKFPRPNPGKCKLTATFAGDAGHDPSDGSDKLAC